VSRGRPAINNRLAGNRDEHHDIEGDDVDDRHTEFRLCLPDAKSTSAMHGDERHLAASATVATVQGGASEEGARWTPRFDEISL
jgi:hypothetical protein